MWKIPLYLSDYGPEEKQALLDVVDSKWHAIGPKTASFEKEFSDYLGGAYCTAVTNGTAALHIALLNLNLQPHDEVIVPALTFVADINVVEMCGAKPVVADCTSLEDWNISPEKVESLITKNTKAIMAVHYAGYPVSLKIREIAAKHKIVYIEDAAHAIGASIQGEKCGAIGDMAAFSFFANKNLTTGEGGMFCARNGERSDTGSSGLKWHTNSKMFRSHGMSTSSHERHYGANPAYDIVQPGLNYRIDEFKSALGLVQFNKLEGNKKRRKALTLLYRNLLAGSGADVPFLNLPEDVDPSYHIFTILLPKNVSRDDVIIRLKEEGIQTSIHYPSYKEYSYYKNKNLQPAPIADEISSRTLTLPLYPTMTDEQAHTVADALLKCF